MKKLLSLMIALTLALADPADGDEAILEGTESWSQLNAAD